MFIIKDKKNKTITYDEGDAYAYKKLCMDVIHQKQMQPLLCRI